MNMIDGEKIILCYEMQVDNREKSSLIQYDLGNGYAYNPYLQK
jgi:hypothetical protein